MVDGASGRLADVPPVEWPALLCRDGSAALVPVRDREEWELDVGRQARRPGWRGRLVDSRGHEFRVAGAGKGPPGGAALEGTGRRLGVAEVRALVERHLSACGRPREWLAAYLSGVPEDRTAAAAVMYVLQMPEDVVGDDEE